MHPCPPSHAGLVRFATRKYSSSKASYHQRRAHLTNYSINRGAARDKQADGGGKAPSAAVRMGDASRSITQGGRDGLSSGGGGISSGDEAADGIGSRGDEDGAAGACADGGAAGGCSGASTGGGSGGPTKSSGPAELKWGLPELRRHMEERGHDWAAIWEQVKRGDDAVSVHGTMNKQGCPPLASIGLDKQAKRVC